MRKRTMPKKTIRVLSDLLENYYQNPRDFSFRYGYSEETVERVIQYIYDLIEYNNPTRVDLIVDGKGGKRL